MNTLNNDIKYKIYSYLSIDNRIYLGLINKFNKNKLLMFEKILFPDVKIPKTANKMIGIWYTIKVSGGIFFETCNRKYMIVYEMVEGYNSIAIYEFPMTSTWIYYDSMIKRKIYFASTWERIKEVNQFKNNWM